MPRDPGLVDLERAIAECAREPIHTPGKTQPFGVALVVDAAARITHVSASVERHLGVAPGSLLGASVREALRSELASAWSKVSMLRSDQVTNLRVVVARRPFDVSGWRRPDGAVVLSLVPADEESSNWIVEEFGELQRHLSDAPSLEVLCDRVAASLWELSGYDRAMVYTFDGDGNGEVVSEARREGLSPFLGLHYPATDIPEQARALYLRSRVRVLADTRAAPDVLLEAAPSGPPVDLSLSLVRAHSPVHVQYLENMGVRATLVVSIVTSDGRLWGLVACHHGLPLVPPARVRMLSELLGEVIAVRVQLQEESEHRRAERLAVEAHHDMLRLLASSGAGWADVIASPHAQPRLTQLVPSDGASCLSAGVIRSVGTTPPEEVIRAVAADLGARLVGDDFHASRASEVAALAPYPEIASGVLAVRLRSDGDAWLFWFRPSRLRRVRWAGDAQKALTIEQGVARLDPRQSFAAWTEEQRGNAEPWTLGDLACARRVRESLIDVLLQLYASTVQAQQLDLVRVKRACEAAGQPLAVLEVTGRPVFLNSAWTTLLGQPDPKVPFDAQLAAPFADVAVRDALREVLAGRRRSFLGESDVASAQPNVRVLAAVDGVFTEGGLPAGAVVVLTDLRERIRSEEERRHMQARVERAERLEALALVTGTVAHDFNNLLTGILCETALLSEEISVETGPQRDAIEQIERTARRAADLCRQLLAYSGKGTFIVRRTDLGALARDVVDVLRPLVPKSVKVVVRATSPQVHAVVDAIQLRQVLMNLVVNACDASGDGRDGRGEVDVVVEPARLEEPTIFGSATEAAPAGSYVVVRVRDHGAGIPEAVRRRIFEPFFSTKRTGKGLGLATVLGIARSHHGVVEVESALGGGTCFSVWLPAAPAVVSEPRLPEALAAGAAGKRVLAVEDEAPALRVVRRILEREGYAVLTAETVASARSVLLDRDLEIDLVFTDLRLPDGSGREVIAASSARDPLLPVILTSGASDSEAPLSPTTPNLVAFLPKPYDRAQLLAAIAAALAGPR